MVPGRWLSAPLRVAAARARRRPGRAVLVAAGVAVSVAMLGAVRGATLVAQDRAVQRAVAALPVPDRAVRILSPDNPDAGYGTTDAVATKALAGLVDGRPVRALRFRDTRIGSKVVALGALDDLGRWVHLRSGRLPATCTPERCEVLQIGDEEAPDAQIPGLALVTVGTGTLASDLPFGDLAPNPSSTDPRLRPPPFLVVNGVASLSDQPTLTAFYRAYAWSVAIDPRTVHVWSVESLAQRLGREASRLSGLEQDYFLVTAPDRTLLATRSEGKAAAGRMLLIGGQAAALLLAFAAVAASAVRRDLRAEWDRLERRGARQGQLWAFLIGETGWAALIGALAGGALAVAAVTLMARATGLGVGDVLTRSILTRWGALALVGSWLAATAVVVGAVRAPDPAPGVHRRVRALDFVGVAALLIVVLAVSRGDIGAADLAGGRSTTLLSLLPVLLAIVAAVVVARLLGPGLRLAERVVRRTAMGPRLALLALARAPARSEATAAFLVVALGLGLFAASYRSTLHRGASDQAAFRVPADLTVTVGRRLARPLDVAPLERYAALAPDTTALPVFRSHAAVSAIGTQRVSITVLGLPAAAIPGLHGWRSDFSQEPAERLAERLTPPAPVRPAGPVLPSPPGTLSMVASADTEADVELTVTLATADGRPLDVPLGEVPAGGTATVSAPVPPEAAGARLAGIDVAVEQLRTELGDHQGSGHGTAGTVRLGPLSAGGVALADWHDWTGLEGMTIRPDGDGARVSLAAVLGGTGRARPHQPTDDRPLPVVVTPDVAAAADPGGRLPLAFVGNRVEAHIVGVIERFPTASGSVVVADESDLTARLEAEHPGSGRPEELWIGTPDPRAVSAALTAPPFDVLEVASRDDIRRDLAADPLARGVLSTLTAAAILALGLALAGMWLVVAGELRDESGELLDLEAQGVPPSILRGQVRWRAAVLGTVGLLGGLGLGLVLATVVAGVVRLAAGGGEPDPPLVPVIGWAVAAIGAAAIVAASAAAVEATARRAFRGGTALDTREAGG